MQLNFFTPFGVHQLNNHVTNSILSAFVCIPANIKRYIIQVQFFHRLWCLYLSALASASASASASAPASSFDLDKLKTSAKSLIETVPYIFKDAKIPDSLKDFNLKDYQFSFNSPSIPLLIGGLAIILIGTIFNFKVLNILGLIVIAVSFIHKTSQQ